MRSGIYRIAIQTSAGQQIYVGQAVDFSARKAAHLRDLRSGRHKNWKMQAAFSDAGEISFHFSPMIICRAEKDILDLYEQTVVDFMFARGDRLMNLSLQCVGSRVGVKASAETKKKMSASMSGKRHSLEARKNISAAKKGWAPPTGHIEHLKALAATERHRKRMAEWARGPGRLAKIGKKKSPDEIARRQATRLANRTKQGLDRY